MPIKAVPTVLILSCVAWMAASNKCGITTKVELSSPALNHAANVSFAIGMELSSKSFTAVVNYALHNTNWIEFGLAHRRSVPIFHCKMAWNHKYLPEMRNVSAIFPHLVQDGRYQLEFHLARNATHLNVDVQTRDIKRQMERMCALPLDGSPRHKRPAIRFEMSGMRKWSHGPDDIPYDSGTAASTFEMLSPRGTRILHDPATQVYQDTSDGAPMPPGYQCTYAIEARTGAVSLQHDYDHLVC
ncbi:hypothetical protein RI367_005739 [Sorochytrium milnesiophthora]